jgi:Uma2 family endonuclease
MEQGSDGMATAMPLDALLTAEEFAKRPDPGYPEELVKGRIVRMPRPGARHGQICTEAVWIFRSFAKEHSLGHVLSSHSGVITTRGPNSVRGADVSFYSYQRLPKRAVTKSYPEVPPEPVVEVRSPGERWPTVLIKVGEHLNVGVSVVVVLDDDSKTAQVYTAERPVRILAEGDEFTLPEVLLGFSVVVRQFFE